VPSVAKPKIARDYTGATIFLILTMANAKKKPPSNDEKKSAKKGSLKKFIKETIEPPPEAVTHPEKNKAKKK
jgi:hypothetical protein